MTLLLLSGTSEAKEISKALEGLQIPAIASLSGATRAPRPTGLPTRVGGFGGNEAFRTYLRREGIKAVLDATHPFASHVSCRSVRICAEEEVPYCQVLRPEWKPQPGDDWTVLKCEEDAARYIRPGATVFLATGRQTLPRFANLVQCRLICRQIDPPEGAFPFPNGEFLVGRPPFSVQEEMDLFQRLGVDWLVVKNAGGTAARSKLDAARQLGLPVAMIARPVQPKEPKVTTAAAALDWVAAL